MIKEAILKAVRIKESKEESTVRSWVIVLSIAVSFLIWGLVIFYAVGTSWPPPWRYGTVADVPGQSIYSVGEAEKPAGTALKEKEKIREQHVRGSREGSGGSLAK